MPDFEFYNGQHTGAEIDQGVEAALKLRKASGIIKSDGNGTISPATQGEDFVAPVTGATQGNFAAFDANGNPVDSGKNANSFSKPIITTFNAVTMLAANWTNNTYSFEAEYPDENYTLEIWVADSATVEQFEAFSSAYVTSGVTGNTVKALNGAPTIDIPVIVKAVTK